MRRLAPAATAILCAIAAGCLAPAGAVAASPLSWSAPVLVDNQGPFSLTTEVRGMSCPSTSLCVGVGPDGKIVTTLDAADGPTATWTVAGVDGQNTIQVLLRLIVWLPRPALAIGARDSVAAVLTAVNANGTSTATAKIARLILV